MNKKLNNHKLQMTRPNEAVGLIGWLCANYILFTLNFAFPLLDNSYIYLIKVLLQLMK